MESGSLETRVTVLEKEMEWAKGNMESIRTDLLELKAGQSWLRDHFIELHRDLGGLQSRTDAQFVEVHKEMAGIHKEVSGIHGAISIQTRWILTAILAGAILYPIAVRLIDRFF